MLFSTSIFLLFSTLTLAHPHARSEAELEWHATQKRSLAACQSHLKTRGFHQASIDRRNALAEHARFKRGIDLSSSFAKRSHLFKRQLGLNESHLSDLTGLTYDTDTSTLFGSNSTCTLDPEVTEGPYYVEGELIRSNITDGQAGLPVWIDLEFIDTSTCEPVPAGIYVDFWHANATGVYSGVVASGNGDGAESNLNSTFCRGVQATNESGVVQFSSIFMGHYTGRANHYHLAAHVNGSVNANGTFTSNNSVYHVGQLFFDQDLVEEVNQLEPYSTNTQTETLNADDSILATAGAEIDPFLDYVLLGSELSDGLLAWASIGIDLSASHTMNAAVTWTEDGGVENANSGMGGSGMGGGGMPGGSGGMSGGSPPPSASGALDAVSTTMVSSASQLGGGLLGLLKALKRGF